MAQQKKAARASTPAGEGRLFKKHEFYSYLMLAIRAKGKDKFEAEGSTFYDAFMAAISFAQEDSSHRVDGLDRMIKDPVFGVVHQANEMLLEAEEDRLISLLNPQLREAHFKISEMQARKELAEAGDVEWFEKIASHFIEAVTSARQSPYRPSRTNPPTET